MDNMKLIEKYMDVLLNSDVHCIIIKGPAGVGKTSTVLSKLKDMGLEEDMHYVYITGYMTPLKLYESLSKSRILDGPKLLIYDDIDALFKNKTSVALLKSALSEARGKRVVSYESGAKSENSRSFEFTGKVILILNSIIKNNTIEPLLDRGIFYEIELEPADIALYIEEHLESMYPSLGRDVKGIIWDKVRRFVDSPNFSLRILNRAFAFYEHDKENWYQMFVKTINKKS